MRAAARAAFAVLLAAACHRSVEPLTSTVEIAPVAPAEVAWTLESLGRVIGVALVDGGALVGREDAPWIPVPGGGVLLERRDPTGGTVWSLPVAHVWLQAFAASDAGELFVVLGDNPEILPGTPPLAGQTGSDLAKVSADGALLWRVRLAEQYPWPSIVPDASGGAQVLVRVSIGERRLRTYAADGSVTAEVPAPADVIAMAADASGVRYVVRTAPPRVERWDAGGSAAWSRAIPVEPNEVSVSPGGEVVVVPMSFDGDFDWAGERVRWEPDRSMLNPVVGALVLRGDGTPADALVGRGNARLSAVAIEGGVLSARPGADGTCTEVLAVTRADGTPAWRRTVGVECAVVMPPTFLLAARGARVLVGGSMAETTVTVAGTELWRGSGYAVELAR